MTKIFKLVVIFMLVSMMAMVVSAQDSESIEYDETVTGELDSQTYEQSYSFEGEEGDTIIIRMTATSEEPRLDSYLFLEDAQGNELAFDDDSAGNLNSLLGPFTLPEDGTYTVIASRFQQENGTSEGTYDLRVSMADTLEIELNESLEIELNADDMVGIYTFVAEESAIYQLNYRLLDGDGGADLSARTPAGEYLVGFSVDSYNNASFTVLSLEEGEEITLFARYYETYETQDSQGNGVRLELSIESVEPESIELDFEEATEISGVLDTVDSVAYYLFEAESGQTLEIAGTAPDGGDFEVYVIIPAGYTSFYGSTMYQQEGDVLVPPQIVTQTGKFVLVVHRTNIYESNVPDDEAIAYDLTLALSGTPELEAGNAIEDSIDSSLQIYENAYIYYGTEGETITISLDGLSDNYALSFAISLDFQGDGANSFYANFNSSVSGRVSYEVTLPVDGAYVVRVYDGAYNPESEPGDYRLLVESDATDE